MLLCREATGQSQSGNIVTGQLIESLLYTFPIYVCQHLRENHASLISLRDVLRLSRVAIIPSAQRLADHGLAIESTEDLTLLITDSKGHIKVVFFSTGKLA